MDPTGPAGVPRSAGQDPRSLSPDERTLRLLRGDLECQEARASKSLLVIPMVVIFGIGLVVILLSYHPHPDDPDRALRSLFLLTVASVVVPLALYRVSGVRGGRGNHPRKELVDRPTTPLDPASFATAAVLLAIATPAMFVAMAFPTFVAIHLTLGVRPEGGALSKIIFVASVVAGGVGVAVLDVMIVKRMRRRSVRGNRGGASLG